MPQFIEEFTFNPPGPAADTYNFTQNSVSFTVEFTDDGDGPDPSPGSGGIGFDANDGVGNSSSIDLLSDFPVSTTPERVTITRDDGEDFIFTSLFVNNEDAPLFDGIDQQVTVAGFNDGVLVGTAQTVDDGEIATLNFGDIVVDEVRLTSNDFFLTKLDNFSGNTTVLVNTAPTINSVATASVPENQTSAIDVNATDDTDSEGSGLTYSLTGIVDDSLFNIDAVTGVVTFINAPDFENPGDAGSDNNYDIQVTVTDSGGLTDVQDIVVTVTDVVENTAPTITTPNGASVEENQTIAIDVNATDDTDSEGSGLTYSLTGIVDDSLFNIDAVTGVVTFINAPDFESPGDADGNNDYQVQVTVTDSGGLTDVQDLTITVTDLAEQTLVISGETATSNLTLTAPTSSVSLSDYLLDAINSNGLESTPQVLSISVPTTATGINLTSFGKTNEATDGVDGSAWRLRNGTTENVGGTLSGYNTGFSNTYNLPANTDTFTISPVANGSATHRLAANGVTKVKAASSQSFDVTNDISGNAYEIIGGTGDDNLTGGNGNDILNGGQGTNVLIGGGSSDLFVLSPEGINTIEDYQDGQDSFLLTSGLSFGSLNIDDNATGDTIISTVGNGVLAIL
ncbi:MAG: hypothetical protein AAGF26_05625, partial [Cyanobacteria bacterium P01_G01_bin.49]